VETRNQLKWWLRKYLGRREENAKHQRIVKIHLEPFNNVMEIFVVKAIHVEKFELKLT
jgi:hypothetical protein